MVSNDGTGWMMLKNGRDYSELMRSAQKEIIGKKEANHSVSRNILDAY